MNRAAMRFVDEGDGTTRDAAATQAQVERTKARLMGPLLYGAEKRREARALMTPMQLAEAKRRAVEIRGSRHYLKAKNGRGQEVTFLWTVRRNDAGYFVAWQEMFTAQSLTLRAGKVARKSKQAARRICEQRWARMNKRTAALAAARTVKPPRPPKPQPSAQVIKLARARAALARWTTKQKRATTAIKKLTAQIRRWEKQQPETV